MYNVCSAELGSVFAFARVCTVFARVCTVFARVCNVFARVCKVFARVLIRWAKIRQCVYPTIVTG